MHLVVCFKQEKQRGQSIDTIYRGNFSKSLFPLVIGECALPWPTRNMVFTILVLTAASLLASATVALAKMNAALEMRIFLVNVRMRNERVIVM